MPLTGLKVASHSELQSSIADIKTAFDRSFSLASAVLEQYQIMIEQAKLDLTEQANTPVIADLLPELDNTVS
jgi:molecular chaperone GrpE (heat shock protein)